MRKNKSDGSPHNGGEPALVFRVSGLMCALPLGSVEEVLPMAQLARPPGLPSILDGFLNRRGTPVPVCGMHRILHLPAAEPGLHSPILILRSPQGGLGLWVDAVAAILEPAGQKPVPLPPGHTFNDCVLARLESQGPPVYLLCAESLTLGQERQIMAGLQALEQFRLYQLREDQLAWECP